MAKLSKTIAEIVRREKSRVVASLVRRLGSIDAAEEAFQEAVLAALPSWRDGLPANPGAWLTTAAKNHARDAARHQRIVDIKSPLLSEHDMALPELPDSFSDEQLRLIFTCCHPALTLDSQVALTLKVVAGLTTDEIARGLSVPRKDHLSAHHARQESHRRATAAVRGARALGAAGTFGAGAGGRSTSSSTRVTPRGKAR